MLHSCFSDTALGDMRLVFAARFPITVDFTLVKATAYPRRSHIVSTGLTSRMPYGRGLRGCRRNGRQQIKRYLERVYLVFCNLCKEPYGSRNCPSLGATSFPPPPE